jgi:uncharacterized protein YyaL (SSP411 family)
MVSGLCDAYRATGEEKYLDQALQTASALRDRQWSAEGLMYRNFKNGRSSIPGFHDDYALFMAACLDLSEVSLEETWLLQAEEIQRVTETRFFDPDSGFYTYKDRTSKVLISHHHEIQDNVIPSSNSVMARNLLRLGHAKGDRNYLDRSRSMLELMTEYIKRYPGGFAGWIQLLLTMEFPFYEIAVVGPEAKRILKEFSREYLPGTLLAGSMEESELPLFRGRFRKDKTHIFVCRDQVCRLPVETVKDAKAELHQR